MIALTIASSNLSADSILKFIKSEYSVNLVPTAFQISPLKLVPVLIIVFKLSISVKVALALCLSFSKFSWRGPASEVPLIIEFKSDKQILPEFPSAWLNGSNI